MNKKTLEKSYRTRSKNQLKKAQELKAFSKEMNAPVGLKEEIKHLRELSKKNLSKAKDIAREIRAEKNRISVGEQRILDDLKTQRAREARASRRQAEVVFTDIEADDTYWQVYIDTALEYATYGQSTHGQKLKILQTPVAKALRWWITTMVSSYGVKAVGYACQRALEDNPFIWDRWIYESDQDGTYSQNTLMILEEYATQYIGEHERRNFDEEELEVDTDTGERYYD